MFEAIKMRSDQINWDLEYVNKMSMYLIFWNHERAIDGIQWKPYGRYSICQMRKWMQYRFY